MTNAQRPAFPITEEETDRIDSGITIYSGLTKREYYAGLAMQGIVSNQQFLGNLNSEVSQVAIACVEMADALLAELDNPTSTYIHLTKNHERILISPNRTFHRLLPSNSNHCSPVYNNQ